MKYPVILMLALLLAGCRENQPSEKRLVMTEHSAPNGIYIYSVKDTTTEREWVVIMSNRGGVAMQPIR